LPDTGFAPNRVSIIPPQSKDKLYEELGDIWLEIPSLGVKTSIVGIPLSENGWDVTWLWNQAGYLQGTAFPTWEGNTVITSHVFLPSGNPGPFVNLDQLYWGNELIIHAYGQQYIYHVRTRKVVYPDDLSIFEHKDEDWVTLITCRTFDEAIQSYKYRVVVQALLIRVEPDTP
jgi:LPXTG-site transpeptidase (sortase) family protein